VSFRISNNPKWGQEAMARMGGLPAGRVAGQSSNGSSAIVGGNPLGLGPW
jgi:hypothetical protein